MPHYGFLVSWQPPEARVKRELKLDEKYETKSLTNPEKANNMAQDTLVRNIKKDIVRSLITISLILILELVVYLAWSKFTLS
jgi:hypothetical protein